MKAPAEALRQLPRSLRERLRDPTSQRLRPPRTGRNHVLYLLRTAHRSAGNPSLEVSLRLAALLDLPLVCLAVVEDTFPATMDDGLTPPRRPTDRAAAFRLEALQELQPAIAARGSVLYVQVDRDGHRAAVAMSLAAKASIVVADEHFGIEPHASAVARVARTGAPVWLCDASCTVPSCVLAPSTLRGGNAAFLRATAAMRATRLARGWFPPPAPPPRRPPPAEHPPWSVDLSAADAVDLVLALPSRRDATVRRVAHTRGGQRAAAARWRAFLAAGGLRTYAKHRNSPLAPDGKGGSRMSAYINLGMVDPTKMARDAAGCPKFLEELVGFRSSAHLWCLLHPGGYADARVAVPAWAQGQLRGGGGGGGGGGGAGAGASPSLAALERGATGDALWDDCQRSLVLAGELHNNVRMAWGKAIPAWHSAALRATRATGRAPPNADPSTTRAAAPPPTPRARLQAALHLLIRLNDKFALDGAAAPSYAGLMWCLGWRDRPGKNGRPKPRPTSVIAKRVRAGDLERRALRICGQSPPVGGRGGAAALRAPLAASLAAGASGAGRAKSPKRESRATTVSILLCTVTFHANLAHSLTRSP